MLNDHGPRAPPLGLPDTVSGLSSISDYDTNSALSLLRFRPSLPGRIAFRRRYGMWEDANYCWVVLCKNHWFHMRQSFLVRHRIPLAETDAFASLPPLPKHFTVRCDECRKIYTYRPQDVLRSELELPKSFNTHRLFQEEPQPIDSARSKAQEQKPHQEEPPQEGQTRAKSA